jgi:hypothetical protein
VNTEVDDVQELAGDETPPSGGEPEPKEPGRPAYKKLYEEQIAANEDLTNRLSKLEEASKEAERKQKEADGDLKGIIEDLQGDILGHQESRTKAEQERDAASQKADFVLAALEGGVRPDALEDAFKLATIDEGADMGDVVATLLDEKSYLKSNGKVKAPPLDKGNKDVPDAPTESWEQQRNRIYGSQGDGVWDTPEQYGGGVVEL